jgi:molecular chaperone DnaK (HSP70)
MLKSPIVLQALKQASEKTKRALTASETATLEIQLDEPEISYYREVSRSEFNDLINPLVEKTIEFCKTAIAEARLTPERIEEVVMVGGSTRVPLVLEKVEEYFAKPLHTDLNPDEVVALGAAIQAQILSGGFKEMMVLDVTPLSLGIETFGGAMSKLIMRNSSIPTRASEQFTTYVDGQTSVDIHVLQGERELAEDCRSLGKWKLTDIPALPANAPKITVTFTLDANGLLKVDAKEERSGKELSIEVQPSSGLTEEEVERMVKESIEHAKSDVESRQRIELRNEIDSIRRATMKALEQSQDECPEELRRTINYALSDLLTAAELEDIHQIQKAIDEFNEASEPLARLQMDAVAKAALHEEQLADL